MGGFHIQKPDIAKTTEPQKSPESELNKDAQRFVTANTDTSSGEFQAWDTPDDGNTWTKRERHPYQLFLSPPQKQAIELAAKLAHTDSSQEFLILLIEKGLREELSRHAQPEIGGVHAKKAADSLAYIQTWGDIPAGRKARGQR